MIEYEVLVKMKFRQKDNGLEHIKSSKEFTQDLMEMIADEMVQVGGNMIYKVLDERGCYNGKVL